jgi:hypothetical protein
LTLSGRSRKNIRMTARARALVAFGAYLCLSAHLMGLVHVVAVRHATCPTHGEVIHTGGADQTSEAPLAAGPTAAAFPVEPAEEGDEHCLFVATRRQDMAGLAPAVAAVAPLPPLFLPLERSPVAVFDPSALLLLAPKTSPPAAA